MSVKPQLNREKWLIMQNIHDYVFGPATRRSRQHLEAICDLHYVLDPNMQKAFIYKGSAYCSNNWRPTARATILNKKLHDQMEQFLIETEQLKKDRSIVDNFLSCLLVESRTLQECSMYAPECIQHCLWPNPRKPDAIEAFAIEKFQSKHANAIQRLKERIVLNMLF